MRKEDLVTPFDCPVLSGNIDRKRVVLAGLQGLDCVAHPLTDAGGMDAQSVFDPHRLVAGPSCLEWLFPLRQNLTVLIEHRSGRKNVLARHFVSINPQALLALLAVEEFDRLVIFPVIG